MTTVVVYNEFKAVQALLSGADHDTVTTDVEAGATRKFELLPGQVLEISEAKDEPASQTDAAGDPSTSPFSEPAPKTE